MSAETLCGLLTTAAGAIALICLAPAVRAAGRAAYQAAQDASERLFLAPGECVSSVHAPNRPDNPRKGPCLPFRPAA